MIGSSIGMSQEAAVERNTAGSSTIGFVNKYRVECVGVDGQVKWADDFENLVTNAGLNNNLEVFFTGGTQTSTWYMGLKNTGAAAPGDTMGSHGGWTENQNYGEANRPTITLGSVSGQSVSNSGNAASFSINTNAQTIAGIFVTSTNVKGNTTGILYGVGDFTAPRAVDDGDTLNVTVTFNAQSGA